MTKTKSSQYRRLIGECRERWNRFDPIGIRGRHADHLNEYDSYLAHTAELLLADADSFKIAAYVRQVVRVSMGISNFPEERIVEFAQELKRLTVPDLLDAAVQIWREAQVVHDPTFLVRLPSRHGPTLSGSRRSVCRSRSDSVASSSPVRSCRKSTANGASHG